MIFERFAAIQIEQLRLLRKRSVHSPDEQVMDVRTELSTLDVMQVRNFVFYKIMLAMRNTTNFMREIRC